jgi:2',3'-cyclic-nucleotide 2'-phosphodiesterase
MSKTIKILFIGDIVGRPGRNIIKEVLLKLKTSKKIDIVFANGENLAGGKGMTLETYKEMIDSGIDYFTSGNHIWKNRDIIPYMKDNSVKVLRPANYPNDPPGLGFVTIDIDNIKITLMNFLGRVFIPELLDDPFSKAKEIAERSKDDIIIVDFHAEATSEKIAFAYFLDGKVSAVFGTHTHVQTADERILPKGTAFISDIGMCGSADSVIGVEKEAVIDGFLTGLPQSLKVAVGHSIFNACLVEIDKKTKKALKIDRISLIQNCK